MIKVARRDKESHTLFLRQCLKIAEIADSNNNQEITETVQ